MEPSPSPTMPDLELGSPQSPDCQVSAHSTTFPTSIDSLFATRGIQLFSPPNSTNSTNSTSSPSHSPLSPSAFPTATTPSQPTEPTPHGSDTTIPSRLMNQVSARGCPTPMRHLSNSFTRIPRRPSMSESSIPQTSIPEIGKRKATDSLTTRPRAMTLPQERPPSSSMLTVPGEVSQPRDSPGYHQNQCTPNAHLHSLTSPPSGQSGFWAEDPDNPDPNNAKRPKPDLRGAKGRQARRVDWPQSRRPKLNKHSTGSMIAGMSLCDDNGQENTLQGSQDIDPGNSDDAGTMMEGCEQTPIRDEIPGPRRLPLRDISARLAVTDDALTESAVTVPLTPLMTRQPIKKSTPQRLVIMTPFPANPGYWNEYANDTLNYLFEIEKRYDRFMYLNAQSEYPVCREAVVQLITELCYSAIPRFTPATLHHAVNLLDRYLSIHNIECLSFNQLQCVGISSFMIAAKLEEGVSSGINMTVLSIAYGIFTPEELAKTEKAILSGLKFEILVASARSFSDYFKQAVPCHPQMTQLADFLCDISLFSHKFLDFETSQIAASALWIALCAIRQDWSEDLGVLTGYRRTDLTHCSVIFRELIFSVDNTLDLSRSLGSHYTLKHILPVLLEVLR